MEDHLREKVRRHFGVGDEDPFIRAEKEKQWRREQRAQHSEAARAEINALAVLDLEPPVDFDKIKARYKQLVKKHHPDVNGGDRDAEEKFKAINQAYSVLKTAFETINSPAEA
jgi:DnaJ-class molecular chaperone